MNSKTSISIQLDPENKFAGFAAENGASGNVIKVISREYCNSDNPLFHEYIDQISKIFFQQFPPEIMNDFLIVIHKNNVADIYHNENLPISFKMLAKGKVEKKELISNNRIADITELKFSNIEFSPTDSLIFCFRRKWNFGLYFDFREYNGKEIVDSLNIEELYKTLGTHFKQLLFKSVYSVYENHVLYKNMLSDGWFPFIQLIEDDFLLLSKYYNEKDFFTKEINSFPDRFNEERVMKFVNNWWSCELFNKKRKLLEVGIKAYFNNDSDGFISCIKNLHPEIDGIIQTQYFIDNNKKPPTSPGRNKYIGEKGLKKFESKYSLGFPVDFINYLNEFFYRKFDFETNSFDFSRNTTAHGTLNENAYNKACAIQAILILDQIFFYIA